jgi:hypothetical protein
MESIVANSNNTNTSQEDIVLKVLGGHHSGHVRGKGCGAKPIQSNSSSAYTQHNHDECLTKQIETEKELVEMQETQATMQVKMQDTKATFQVEIKKSKATQVAMQAQMEMLLNHLER